MMASPIFSVSKSNSITHLEALYNPDAANDEITDKIKDIMATIFPSEYFSLHEEDYEEYSPIIQRKILEYLKDNSSLMIEIRFTIEYSQPHRASEIVFYFKTFNEKTGIVSCIV